MSSLRTFFRHCPNCGRRFEIRLVSKKLEGSQVVGSGEPTLRVGLVGRDAGAVPLVLTENVPAITDVEEFQYTYRCKHCGHEWAEVRDATRSAGIPKGYTGD
jgi:predicted RNA-binding Zn-ribbon protein involved in translation (DUF1610 family)